MTDPLEEAVRTAAEYGAPPKTFRISPNAYVDFGTGRNPFDGMTVTDWTDNFDAVDVLTGRCE